jgi:hypothetical protein
MQKTLSTAAAAILLATSAIATGAAAESRHHSRFDQQDRVVQSYCRDHRDSSCRDWDRNRNNWDESHYQRWYRDHHRHRGFDADNAIAGIFGFALGSMIGGTIEHGGRTGHVAACEDHFRSYDRRTDTYLGYDGARHYCRL